MSKGILVIASSQDRQTPPGRSVAILGSTGSIGRRTLDVIRSLGPGWSVAALTAGSNWQELAEQARQFSPAVVAVADEACYEPLKAAVASLPVRVLAGAQGVLEAASLASAQIVVCAIVGAASIAPAFAALRAGKDLALASKEALVVTGERLLDEAARSGSRIIPVDSEHSAVLQAMRGGSRADVVGITLTASGGPFRDWPAEKVRSATVDEALNHPTWSMGRKITIDSATMMNKALEIIEAHYLFDLPVERINVLIHPESIVHAMVEFRDAVVIAQMSVPDMALPIQYALTGPNRFSSVSSRLDLTKLGRLTFYKPDDERFPALRLGYLAARQGGTSPAVLNAANEGSVEAFLAGKIPFGRIVELTERVLSQHEHRSRPELAELLEIDRWARNEVTRCLSR